MKSAALFLGLLLSLSLSLCVLSSTLPIMASLRSMKKVWTIRIVALVILLNAFQLFRLLLQHSSPAQVLPPPLEHLSSRNHGRNPWPAVPSFRPWIADPRLPPSSCEGYFGHGFVQAFDVLGGRQEVVGAFRKLQEFREAWRSGRGGSDFVQLGRGHGAGEMRDERFGFRQEEQSEFGYGVDTNGKELTYLDSGIRPLHLREVKQLRGRITEPLENKSQFPSPSGSFLCLFSETLRTSICSGANVVMHPDRIRMSKGGEPLESVIGRTDEEELPAFEMGAFEIQVPAGGSVKPGVQVFEKGQLDSLVPVNGVTYHTMRMLFESIRTVSPNQELCSKEIVEPTLIVTRFEYANLFHTLTDWYSAYVTARVLDLPQRPNVIFLDGHCQSPMDDGWFGLFGNVTYAKSLTGLVCFHHAIFTPLGYETALFKGLSSGIPCHGCSAAMLETHVDHSKTARLREFGEMFKLSLGVTDVGTNRQDIKILFVRRENYLAHPRHKGRPETRLSNEQELFDSLQSWAQAQSQLFRSLKVSVINGLLAHLQMKEQVQAVDEASIILGAHGAGLAHIVFARPGSVILELLGPTFQRPHYAHISQWMGIEYHSINMRGTVANCAEVLDLLTVILRNIAKQKA